MVADPVTPRIPSISVAFISTELEMSLRFRLSPLVNENVMKVACGQYVNINRCFYAVDAQFSSFFYTYILRSGPFKSLLCVPK